MSWFTDIIRWFFFQIDNIVYGLISILYELLMYLANLDLFGISSMYTGSGFVLDDNNLIFKFASRIYVFLGVIMLFQIAFAILQYMVNPDAFSDKGKGFGKLITNCLVSLVLIVTVPFIFAFAYNVQSKILSNNVIGKIVLGNSVGDSTSINAANKTMSVDMQFLVFGTFASIDDDVFYGICKDGPVLGTKAMVQATGTYDPNNDYGEKEENASCLDRVQKELMMDGDEERSNIGYFFRTADKDGRDFSKYSDIINVKDSQGTYIIDYMFIISTIVGVVVVLLLISSCIEVAVRAIKLAFLEIIAPIPIVSYMDPRKSYSDSMLHKWIKECSSTFASLFIRLAIIYFVFFMVDAITSTILATNTSATYANGDVPSGWMAILVQVMIIIGLLIFANQIPKLIEGITGIKASGNFSLNPLKTITQSPIAAGVLGGAVGGAVAGLGGMTANAISAVRQGKEGIQDIRNNWGNNFSNFKNQWNSTGTGFKGLRNKANLVGGRIGSVASPIAGIVTGGVSAAARGGLAGSTGKNAIKGIKTGIQGATEARNTRDINRGRYGIGSRVSDKISQFANIQNKDAGIGKIDRDIKNLQRNRENLIQQESGMRQAQAQFISGTKHTMKDFDAAFYASDANNERLLDANGNKITYDYNQYMRALNESGTYTETFQMRDENGNLMFDENGNAITFNAEVQGLKDKVATGEINQVNNNDFDIFASNERSIIDLDIQAESIRQEQGKLQEISDAQGKPGGGSAGKK